ncbi:MAG TPA: copper-binding protein [Blastocatellia bacterium]|nr:copper-binding protein [Blastocatellia bacterium]
MKVRPWSITKARRVTGWAALSAAALIISASLAACRGRPSGGEQRYDLKGVVVNVDKRGSTVTVAHHEILGYMDAMTMPFKLKDEWAFDVLAPGNRVQATLVVDGSRSWLENVVVIEEAVDSSASKGEASATVPSPGDEVPDFTLVNQDGKRIRLRGFRGRALLVTFIYTRCPIPDYCPLMTTNFEEVTKALKQDPLAYSKTHLLSVSVDPDYDTPERLREYGAARTNEQGAQAFSHWEFATGTPDEVKKVAAYFGLQYWKDADQITHSLVTAVISPDGRVAKLYPGNEWQPDEVVSLLASFKHGQTEAKQQPASRDKDAAKIYHGVGVVESINEERTTVQINHEDIKDLMPAMNMPFEVKDKSLLDQIAPGDPVTFALQNMPYGLVVVEIKKR